MKKMRKRDCYSFNRSKWKHDRDFDECFAVNKFYLSNKQIINLRLRNLGVGKRINFESFAKLQVK